jgi:hypothetical protein
MALGSVRTLVATCESCGATLPPSKRPKRPRRFCNSTCRSKAYWDREEQDMKVALVQLGAIRSTFDKVESALRVRTQRKSIQKRHEE